MIAPLSIHRYVFPRRLVVESRSYIAHSYMQTMDNQALSAAVGEGRSGRVNMWNGSLGEGRSAASRTIIA